MTETKACKIEGCKKPYRAKGFCSVHFKKWRAGELEGYKTRYKICGEEECKVPMFKAGYCEKHYQAWIASKKDAPATAEAPAAEAPAAEKPAE